MRISDWSSDVCSSDLTIGPCPKLASTVIYITESRIPFLDLHIPKCFLHSSEQSRRTSIFPRFPVISPFLLISHTSDGQQCSTQSNLRPEARRVGKEVGITLRTRGSPCHKKKKN